MASHSSSQPTGPANRARRRGDLHVEELDAEAVVFDAGNGAVHRLDAVTFFVWNACDGTQTLAELANDVATRFGIAQAEAAAAVESAVVQLGDKGLLDGGDALAGTSADKIDRRFSRREILRGGVGKAMLAAPVISTFFATGAYASGPSFSAAWGAGGCKNIGYSCVVNGDCCAGSSGCVASTCAP